MSEYTERRQKSKLYRVAYRDAARRILDTLPSLGNISFTVSPHANVVEDSDKTGAFVECTIWVPREDIE